MALGLSTIYFTGERMALATTIMGFSIAILFIKKFRFYFFAIIVISFLFTIININFHPEVSALITVKIDKIQSA